MGIKQVLLDCIPPAYYEDGTEAKCWIYKVCNMFDVDPQSYKIVKESNNMEEDPEFGNYNFLERYLADIKKIDKEFEDKKN